MFLIGSQNLVLFDVNYVIKFVNLISAQFFYLFPFFLFVTIALSWDSRHKQLHSHQRVGSRLMRVTLPFDIRFIRLLRKRTCAYLKLLDIIKIRKVFVALFKELVLRIRQNTILRFLQYFHHISKVKARIECYPRQVLIFQ